MILLIYFNAVIQKAMYLLRNIVVELISKRNKPKSFKCRKRNAYVGGKVFPFIKYYSPAPFRQWKARKIEKY